MVRPSSPRHRTSGNIGGWSWECHETRIIHESFIWFLYVSRIVVILLMFSRRSPFNLQPLTTNKTFRVSKDFGERPIDSPHWVSWSKCDPESRSLEESINCVLTTDHPVPRGPGLDFSTPRWAPKVQSPRSPPKTLIKFGRRGGTGTKTYRHRPVSGWDRGELIRSLHRASVFDGITGSRVGGQSLPEVNYRTSESPMYLRNSTQ